MLAEVPKVTPSKKNPRSANEQVVGLQQVIHKNRDNGVLA